MILRGDTLDRQITIRRFVLAPNDYGDPVGSYAPLATVWAGLRIGRGSERVAAAQVEATLPTTFRIRWSDALDPNSPDGLSPKDRIEYPSISGRLYDISSVVELGRREGIEIIATARVDQ